uniref:MarR family winged helix-turn-helix transcriptional regulator n=1 Tax=uncultured Draconibacterium sp. TaxID=1573823 RepID=UPI0032178E68
MSKYDTIKQLIDLYDNFEQEERTPDVLSFAQWVCNKYDTVPPKSKLTNKTFPISKQQSDIPFYKILDVRARFLENIAEIARYHEFYSRKALKDLEINSRVEYLFLKAVDSAEQIKKTDLINNFHTEYTTGMDTIRRLLKNELLMEVVNVNDKRSKLLELTGKGEKVLAMANKNMEAESKMFLLIVNDNKWKKTIFALEEINDLHRFVYDNHGNKSFAEICNLMESLKYLYK